MQKLKQIAINLGLLLYSPMIGFPISLNIDENKRSKDERQDACHDDGQMSN